MVDAFVLIQPCSAMDIFAIKYKADALLHLSIFDPENPVDDAGNYNPVHEFTGNDQGQMDDLNICLLQR